MKPEEEAELLYVVEKEMDGESEIIGIFDQHHLAERCLFQYFLDEIETEGNSFYLSSYRKNEEGSKRGLPNDFNDLYDAWQVLQEDWEMIVSRILQELPDKTTYRNLLKFNKEMKDFRKKTGEIEHYKALLVRHEKELDLLKKKISSCSIERPVFDY